MSRLVLAVCFMGLLSCATTNSDSIDPTTINATMLEKKAVFIGSILLPASHVKSRVALWNGTDAALTSEYRTISLGLEVPTTNPNARLGYFALTDIWGQYRYSSVEAADAAKRRSTPPSFGNVSVYGKETLPSGELLNLDHVGEGNLVYIGRFVCRPDGDQCDWRLSTDSKVDIPVLKSLNPTLTWDQLMTIENGLLKCVTGEKNILNPESRFFRNAICVSETD